MGFEVVLGRSEDGSESHFHESISDSCNIKPAYHTARILFHTKTTFLHNCSAQWDNLQVHQFVYAILEEYSYTLISCINTKSAWNWWSASLFNGSHLGTDQNCAVYVDGLPNPGDSVMLLQPVLNKKHQWLPLGMSWHLHQTQQLQQQTTSAMVGSLWNSCGCLQTAYWLPCKPLPSWFMLPCCCSYILERIFLIHFHILLYWYDNFKYNSELCVNFLSEAKMAGPSPVLSRHSSVSVVTGVLISLSL